MLPEIPTDHQPEALIDLANLQHPIEALSQKRLPALRLFDDYAPGPNVSLQHLRESLALVQPSFWSGITHFIVVAAIGAQNLGKTFLLNTLFGLQLKAFDGVATTFVDLAVVRCGHLLVFILDTEGNNAAIEQARDVREIDDVPTGESIRSNFVMNAANLILLSIRYADRDHFQGCMSELDNLFNSAKRPGSSTNKCIVMIVFRDVDAEFRDRDGASRAGPMILEQAEERREYHVQGNRRYTEQLKRFEFRVSMLPHPRDHHSPDAPPTIALQQLDSGQRFANISRGDVSDIINARHFRNLAQRWIDLQWWIDVVEPAIQEARNPPFVFNVVGRFLRRGEIDKVYVITRDRITGKVIELQRILVNRSRASKACTFKDYPHECHKADLSWIHDARMQESCVGQVFQQLRAFVSSQVTLTDLEARSEYVSRYDRLLHDTISKATLDRWREAREEASNELQVLIALYEYRIQSLFAEMTSKKIGVVLQGVIDQHPGLRAESNNFFVSLWPVIMTARQQILLEIDCFMSSYTSDEKAVWYDNARGAKARLLGQLDAGFNAQTTVLRRAFIDLPEWFALAARYGGEFTNYLGSPTTLAILGSFFGPMGLVAGAVTGGGGAYLVRNPVRRWSEAVGRATGRVWQEVIHRVIF